jgi:hypothetical protein
MIIKFLKLLYAVILAMVHKNAMKYQHCTASKLSTLKVDDNTTCLHCNTISNTTFIFYRQQESLP